MGTAIKRHDRLEEWRTPFRLLFARPTWQRLVVLAAGAILTTHRRTVAAVLRVITLFADEIHKAETIVARSARCYAKETVTFSDALAAVRRQLWTDQTFAMPRHDPLPQKPPDAIIERLIGLACYAA